MFFYISESKNVNKFCDQLPRFWSGCRGDRQSVPFGFAPLSCKCLPPGQSTMRNTLFAQIGAFEVMMRH